MSDVRYAESTTNNQPAMGYDGGPDMELADCKALAFLRRARAFGCIAGLPPSRFDHKVMILTQCAVCATELGLSLGKKCGRCSTRYCGPACQKKHWEEGGHDQLCKNCLLYTSPSPRDA